MTFLLLNMNFTYYSSWENWFFKKDQLFFPICFYLFSCPFVMYFKNMKKKITKTHFEIFNNSLISLTPGPLCTVKVICFNITSSIVKTGFSFKNVWTQLSYFFLFLSYVLWSVHLSKKGIATSLHCGSLTWTYVNPTYFTIHQFLIR